MSARELLDKLNVMIDRGETRAIPSLIRDFPHTHELLNAYDLKGQGVFFKLAFPDNEQETLRLMEELARQGGDLKHKDTCQQTVLYYAGRHQRPLLVQFLLRAGLPVNDPDYYLQTPLYYCAKYNQSTHISEMLLDAGCEINHKDANGQTCIFYAAGEGRLQMCRMLIEHGANPFLADKNKERAIHYAKKNGHSRAVQFLNSCRGQVRKVKQAKQQRRMQSSSQNTVDKRNKKRQIAKNQYSLVYVNQEGQIKMLSYAEVMRFKSASEDNERLFRMISEPDDFMEQMAPPPDKRYEKTILKILNHFIKDQNAHFFNEPVNYKLLGLVDYLDVVKFPMDFSTIKKKITYNGYENQIQFQGDMNLVFDNCILYNGTNRDIGKIALQMKTEFNAMFIKEFS